MPAHAGPDFLTHCAGKPYFVNHKDKSTHWQVLRCIKHGCTERPCACSLHLQTNKPAAVAALTNIRGHTPADSSLPAHQKPGEWNGSVVECCSRQHGNVPCCYVHDGIGWLRLLCVIRRCAWGREG